MRFFRHVDVGHDISVETLKEIYPIIIFATGAESGKSLGIEGETLSGIHQAKNFVSWYNAVPENKNDHYCLQGENAVIIGMTFDG